MNNKQASVSRHLDAKTNSYYLRGVEKTTAKQANVFGNGRFTPLSSAKDKKLSYEIEVKFKRTQTADDDVYDYADIYSFRLLSWSDADPSPSVQVLQDWGLCIGNHLDSENEMYRVMLRVGIERINSVREGGDLRPSVVVGGVPKLSKKKVNLASAETTRQVQRWVDDLAQRRHSGALERQLKRQKKALARCVLQQLNLHIKPSVGTVALKEASAMLILISQQETWSTAKLNRGLLDLQQGFGYYRSELRDKYR